MSKDEGLKQKYRIERVDGKPIPDNFGCIVLEWEDYNARVAIRAFADQVEKDGYLALAEDLRAKLSLFDQETK